MDDFSLLGRRKLTLVVIMSGAVHILFVADNVLLVVDIVVVVVGSGLGVVRHLCGGSKFGGEGRTRSLGRRSGGKIAR